MYWVTTLAIQPEIQEEAELAFTASLIHWLRMSPTRNTRILTMSASSRRLLTACRQ